MWMRSCEDDRAVGVWSAFMWMRVGSLIWMMVCGGVARLRPWPSGIAGDGASPPTPFCGDADTAARMTATSRPTCASMRLALGS